VGRWSNGIIGFLLKGVVICVGFTVVFLVTYRLNQSYLRQTAQTVAVLAATQDLLPGEERTADKLRMVERAAFGLGGDYADDLETLMRDGAWYIGDIGFGAGDVIYLNRLQREYVCEEEKWLGEHERQGRVRLIAIETNLVRSSGDWLWPGAYADALVYIPAKDSYDDPQPSQVISRREDPLLGGLYVVSVKNSGGIVLGDETTTDGYGRDITPAVVTLMVKENDISRMAALVRYNEEGKIYLSPAEPIARK